MKLNTERTRELLQNFDFRTLFTEELGWNNPKNPDPIPFQANGKMLSRKAIAELSGAVIFEITADDGNIPEGKERESVSIEIQKIKFEHILIFIDKERTQTIWRWIKKQDKKSLSREHYYSKGQSGDLFISKLAALVVDISEIENDITITDVATKIQNALDIQRVTKKFFGDYEKEFIDFVELIKGIDNEADRKWYASVILNRLMFIYFLQKKFFLDNGNEKYLSDKLDQVKKTGENKFYSLFLNKLFFEGFAKPEDSRDAATNKLIGKIKYLNGGLFLKHKIELKYKKINIPDIAFDNLFGLFDKYSWTLNDIPGGKDDEINPDVLGYIFEKYINQKAFGAYYTRTEITEYLCEQTVYKLILDEINGPEIKDEDLKYFDGKTKNLLTGKRYENIAELLLNLDADTCKKLLTAKNAILPGLSLLDPACGSGAFLVAAMKTLINVYSSVLGKIDFLGDKSLIDWKKKIENDHPSINYFIKKQIITSNLYGVDIMEEATEIAKLRLFLALVASAQTVDHLEPLPNIDFNIMNGNSLIGLMRVDSKSFENHLGTDLFRKGYDDLLREKNNAINLYRNYQMSPIEAGKDSPELQSLKEDIEKHRAEAMPVLNDMLMMDFNSLKIKYEQTTWDGNKNTEGKSKKRDLNLNDINALEPFHWGYEFSEIFKKKDGFDAIITNPPWEIFKPNGKEFFTYYSDMVTKKKMNIKDFEKEQAKLLKDKDIREAWLDYESRFPHVSLYFRNVNQFKNQISVVNGKKAGTDINLYKLFTEQCFNLLKKGGYCGIVIPSGIYTDLGTKQIRQMLFEDGIVTGLFCFENKKEIFEGVHRSFKFVVLSFEKGGATESFPAAFMRHDVKELQNFPQYGASQISVDFIKRQSPDSLSVMEVKNDIEFIIAEKMLKFPMLGEEMADTWNVKLAREFDMTNDSHLFKTKPGKNTLPLYEGKMIWQFNSHYAEAKYWIDEKEGRKAVLGKKDDNGQVLDYQTYRLGFRDIAANTNERTLVSSVIPKTFHGNKLPTVINIDDNENMSIHCKDLFCVCSFWNSFTVDWHIRNRVTTTLNFHYIFQTPVPRLTPNDKFYKEIKERAARLICTTPEFAELWEDVMKSKWNVKLAATDENERNKIRAELDAMIAIIYDLTEEEFTYILSTFPIVLQSQKDATMEEFRKLMAENKDPEATRWKRIINSGESDKIEFKSTLRVDLKTGKPEKFIGHSISKTLAAFLNSDGGTLLIGVEDNKNICGLGTDFNSFSKPDKLDEFKKHFDNLMAKTLGNKFYHYLNVEFPILEGKTICAITTKEKAKDHVYITDENNREMFYIRRLASTVELKPSEAVEYIRQHWDR